MIMTNLIPYYSQNLRVGKITIFGNPFLVFLNMDLAIVIASANVKLKMITTKIILAHPRTNPLPPGSRN